MIVFPSFHFQRFFLLFIVTFLFFHCKPGAQQSENHKMNNDSSTAILTKNEFLKTQKDGVKYIYEIAYEGPDQIESPERDHDLKLLYYKENERKSAKILFQDKRSYSGIVAFNIEENTFHETDIEKDGKLEIHFVYTVEKEELKPTEINMISIVDGKDLLIRGVKNTNDGGHGKSSYFTKAYDKKFSNFSTSIKDYCTGYFDQFVMKTGANFIAQNVTQNSTKKKLNQDVDADFKDWLIQFEQLELPYEIRENELGTIKSNKIDKSLIKRYICEVKGSTLGCVLSPEESETMDGINLTNQFKSVGKIAINNGVVVIYKLDVPNNPVLLLASYNKQGELLSRIRFTGSSSDSESLHGVLSNHAVIIFRTKFDYGHKNDAKHFKWQKEKKYSFDDKGYLVRKNGKRVLDTL